MEVFEEQFNFEHVKILHPSNIVTLRYSIKKKLYIYIHDSQFSLRFPFAELVSAREKYPREIIRARAKEHTRIVK